MISAKSSLAVFLCSMYVMLCGSTIASDIAVLPLRQQAQIIDGITSKRINQLLPNLMQQTDIDMWVLISREYNEDPVLKTVLPATWMSARRTTMFVFVRQGDKVKALAIAPYKVGTLFEPAWDKKSQPNQWQALVELIEEHDPKTIGINQSKIWPHADGLVATDKQRLLAELPQKFERRLVSAEALAVRWLETRIPEEVELLKGMTALAHDIIAQGFSDKIIEPGRTSSDDLVWWFREKVDSLKLNTWFHPSVSIQRSDNIRFDHEDAFTNGTGSQVIQRGDLLHVDFGISYLRLNTDIYGYLPKSKPCKG